MNTRKLIIILAILFLLYFHNLTNLFLDATQAYFEMRVDGASHSQATCELGQYIDNIGRYTGKEKFWDNVQIIWYDTQCSEGLWY